MRKKLNLNEFNRNVVTVMTGTTIAQAIPIAIMPILTRLYTPEEFGIFALYVAIASIFGVIATARYELAIMLPKKDSEAANLFNLSIIITFIISLFTLLFVFIFHQPLINLIGNPEIGKWLYFIPLTVLFTGLYQTLNYWSSRKKNFKRLAISRVVQGGSTASLQLGLNYVHNGATGLILGTIFGQAIATGIFAKMVRKEDKNILKTAPKAELVESLKKYRKFPLFSTWGALLDNAALQMPVFILVRFFSSQTVGLFNLTFRALNLPMALIAAAISQVFFQKITALHHQEPEALFSYVLKLFLMLIAMTIPFILLMHFCGEVIFAFVFGPNWVQAGKFSSLLVFAVAIRFAVSPLSPVLAMDHNIKTGFYWQLTYFVTITITLFMASHFDIYQFIIIFVIHEIVLYGLYLFLILNGCRQGKDVQLKEQFN